MIKQWLSWINLGVFGFTILLLMAGLFVSFTRPSEIAIPDQTQTKRSLPTTAFTMPKQACDAIGKAGFDLKFSPITLQLPDLRNHLIYYGKNGRPDARAERPVLHFGLAGNQMTGQIASGERLYLLYDRKRTPAQYVFSQDNAETSLWIEPTSQGNEVVVRVGMKNETGEMIREPEAHAVINLVEREGIRSNNGGKPWEMDKWRVDGSLLARQKARWIGPDLFLDRHGGEEFKELKGKHRIDFSDEEESYSVYVGLNDTLIWNKGRWQVTKPGEDSLGYPLMVVKKVDERLMNFELWDIGGRSKVILNLVRMNEPWMPQNIQANFRFLGARTRSQYIFEINDQRILLSPKDWLLQTSDGWIKLATAKEIDDYVEHKLTGVLFICDGLGNKEGKQVLKGVIFNASRTEMQEIELAVQQQGTAQASKAAPKDEDEDDKDEIDDSDADD